MKRIFIVLILLGGCASSTKFEKKCEGFGFNPQSSDFAICVDRETEKVKQYLRMKDAKEKNDRESAYRDIKRKELGLDIP